MTESQIDHHNKSAAAALPAASQLRRGHRWVRVGWTLLAAIVGLLLIGVIAVSQWDWNRAKPWLSQTISEATGRQFAVEGNLSASWRWPQPLEESWHRWVPGITLEGTQLVMQDPPGFVRPAKAAAARPTARADMARASLKLWPLLAREVVIDSLELTGPDIALARLRDGSNNWTLPPPRTRDDTMPRWTFRIDQLLVRKGQLAYADAARDLDLTAHVDTLNDRPQAAAPQETAFPASATADAASPSAYGVRFDFKGTLGKARVQGEGKAGRVLTLRDKEVNYPLQFTTKAGSVETAVEGVLANPGALSGMDFQVMLKGASMADLYALTGLVLPNTPAFQTRGRLLGSLQPGRAVWDYRDFTGTVGQSDLHGTLRFVSGAPRGKLSGDITSNQLRLVDLGPVLGTATTATAQQAGRNGKVLPDAAFATDRWNAMDMDLKFAGQRVVRPNSLPLEDLSVHARLEDAVLRLEPLHFGVAKGQIDSKLVLDSRNRPLTVRMDTRVQNLRLASLFPEVELTRKSLGRLDGALALNGKGSSVAQWLGTSTGEARLYVRDGTLSRELLDRAALNVGSIVVGKLFGDDKEVQLRCAVADLAVRSGVATVRTAKLSTNEAVVDVTGTIDLAQERLNLSVKPSSLQWKFFSLRTPLYVRGTLGKPQVGVEPGPLLLRAGAAIAAAVAAPAALALVPVTVPGADDDAQCAPLLAQATQPVRAGPAGTPAARAPSR
ncbi:AsmA family protein [Acidovorax sp. Root70]|uniref:AsmA family protein n=1 Tax=Acidovorax sp. Root70 TaxID=1736590 RepID=UPI0006F44FEB|nr:AsmA family protein [Acidovorax sp. Root70]KRB27792.1 membrane assembly protein AsmA [Acidovorax sp. Root70]